MTRRYLVTGGAGFIGSNFIRHLLDHEPDAQVTNLDALTYAGVQRTVDELDAYPGHHFVHGDIRDERLVNDVVAGADVVVHFAAESHVDRSIEHPSEFLSTNVSGTGVLLAAAARRDGTRFVHVSTDEVYGSLSEGFAKESDPLAPSSPYSASKAGSDLLALSYVETYDCDVLVTRCTNNYGPYQFPEKAIPLFVTTLMGGGRVPLYGDGLNERDWLYVEDHCAALHLLVDKGETGTIYNIGAGEQRTNMELTQAILDVLDLGEERIEFVPDRPGHDRRYAVDSDRVRSLGWTPTHSFSDGLSDTIDWYQSREDWWRPLMKGTG